MKMIYKYFIALCLCIMVVACSKLTQTNFDKIQTGMSMQQVSAILGEPTTSQGVDFAGISGTSATWQDKNVQITIQFLNDKAQIKSFNKVDTSSNPPTP